MSSDTCARQNYGENEAPNFTRSSSSYEMDSMYSMSSSFPHLTRPVSIDQNNSQRGVYDGTHVHREGLHGALGLISEFLEKVPAKIEHILHDNYVNHRENEAPVIVERGTATISSRGINGNSSQKLERFKIRTPDLGDDVEEQNVKR